jgi:hypothetical protein
MTQSGQPTSQIYAKVLTEAPGSYLHVSDAAHIHLPVKALMNQRRRGSVVVLLEPGTSKLSPLGILGPKMQLYVKNHPFDRHERCWIQAATTVRDAAEDVLGNTVLVQDAFRRCGLHPGSEIDRAFVGDAAPARKPPRIANGLWALLFKRRFSGLGTERLPYAPVARNTRDLQVRQITEMRCIGENLAEGITFPAAWRYVDGVTVSRTPQIVPPDTGGAD